MAKFHQLTESQLEILGHFWETPELSVNQLVEKLRPGRDLSRSTVATLVARLEKKGLLGHRESEQGFLYRPLVTREEVCRSRVRGLVDSLFSGDPRLLVNHLLAESPDREEIRAAIRLIEGHGETSHD